MPRHREVPAAGDHRGDAWILTTCILLHSGVGLLQGVRGRGALRCRGAKGQRSAMPAQISPSPPCPWRCCWGHTAFPATVSLSWGRTSETGSLNGWKGAALSPAWGPQEGGGLLPLVGGCRLPLWGAAEGLGGSCRRLGRAGKETTERGSTMRG